MKEHLTKAIVVLLITAGITLVGNWIGTGVNPLEALPGMLMLLALAFVGVVLNHAIPVKIPAVVYIVTIGAIITYPTFPLAPIITPQVSKVNFLALATPILAYAGIYTGENTGTLKKTGPKLLVLAIFVMIATYVGSAIIAEIVLRLTGQI